ncbi:EAL domain-containing protein [Leucothrix sargassi]|nr:EAL domain-containing protein [Leucothrix sargassi]
MNKYVSTGITMYKKVVVMIAFLFLFVGVSGFFLMTAHENNIITAQSVSAAEMVARQATVARFAYATNVLRIERKAGGRTILSDEDFHEKVGQVLTPAEFLKGMAATASETSEGLYRYSVVSKWNLAEEQSLNNEFLKWAWEELEAQDQASPKAPIKWQPVYRIENIEGVDTLRYLQADPALADSCVSCHNIYEQKPEIIERRKQQGIPHGKVFKKYQLMGGIFVEIPVESLQVIAAKQSKLVIAWIMGVLTFGLLGLALFFSRDILRARGIRKQLFWQARHDMLTRLPNRISFEDRLEELLEDARENDTTHALCFLDLDQFKLVNDTCGHAAGDELLCQVSKRLNGSMKPNDFLARLGGDEFGVLLTNCDIEKATLVAQRLCRKIKNYNFIKNENFFDIGASIGVVLIDKEGDSVERLMKRADIACYAAKDEGKNRVQVYQDTDEIINLRRGEASWVSEILKALDENRIVIYSQQIGALSAKTTYAHHEILVRLIDRTGKKINPETFMPAAERYKLMPKLDLAIIQRAFTALSSGHFSDLGETGFISINLSGQSLSEDDCLETVKAMILRYDIDPRQLCFEITESTAIANQERVQRFMREMRKLGIKFALDDFGTGLSSLTYLKEFPVDYLKIDGSFIKDIVNDPVDRSLVDAINQMAHTLGLRTIAEYVESEEIFDLLKTMKIDYAQGYFIQKPIRVDVKRVGA